VETDDLLQTGTGEWAEYWGRAELQQLTSERHQPLKAHRRRASRTAGALTVSVRQAKAIHCAVRNDCQKARQRHVSIATESAQNENGQFADT
jgi:hypothetical protein